VSASSDDQRQPPVIQVRPSCAERDRQSVAASAPWPGLEAAALAIGVPLDARQLGQFATYRQCLLDWNVRFNLTAITDPVDIERRLFLDALLLVPSIDRLTPGEPARLVDIGSGAGFPGVPLAIARPDLAVTLIEATGKKVSFLNHLISELDLRQGQAIHARAEDVARQSAHRGAYDLATARAVASLPALIELTMPLLRRGGHALLPKGLDLGDELAAGTRAASQVGARIVSDEIAAASSTRIVIVTKELPTPDRYPRRPGIPAREPLGITPAGLQTPNLGGTQPFSPKIGGGRADRRDGAHRRVTG
jgi:16S rRNA (guanine527-N7)-methyltransferase